MNGLIPLLATGGLKLYDYFTKNKGLNSVTSAGGSALLTLTVLGMQSGGYDQVITFLQNHGEAGLVAAATMAALRTFVFVYNASKPKQ